MSDLIKKLEPISEYLKYKKIHGYSNTVSKAVKALAAKDKRIAELETALKGFCKNQQPYADSVGGCLICPSESGEACRFSSSQALAKEGA